MRKAGEVLDSFGWKSSDGESHSFDSLSSHKAVVFFFYPGDFTPGCTKEVCFFRDHFAELQEAGAALFGVSLDDDDSHERFREKHSLPFPLISDHDKSISKQFGVLRLGGFLKVRRATFVVDPQSRKLLDAFSNEFNMNAHATRVLSLLDSSSTD